MLPSRRRSTWSPLVSAGPAALRPPARAGALLPGRVTARHGPPLAVVGALPAGGFRSQLAHQFQLFGRDARAVLRVFSRGCRAATGSVAPRAPGRLPGPRRLSPARLLAMPRRGARTRPARRTRATRGTWSTRGTRSLAAARSGTTTSAIGRNHEAIGFGYRVKFVCRPFGVAAVWSGERGANHLAQLLPIRPSLGARLKLFHGAAEIFHRCDLELG